MLEAIHKRRWALRNVREVPVHRIVPHHGDDLVVRITAVGEAQSADRQCRQEYIAVWNTLFR